MNIDLTRELSGSNFRNQDELQSMMSKIVTKIDAIGQEVEKLTAKKVSLPAEKSQAVKISAAEISPLAKKSTSAPVQKSTPKTQFETEAIVAMLINHFDDYFKSAHLLDLDIANFVELISRDELQVKNEWKVFESVIYWIKHDLTNRSENLLLLLDQIRLDYLTEKQLVLARCHPLIENSPEIKCRQILDTNLRLRHCPELNKGKHKKKNLGPRKFYGRDILFAICGYFGGFVKTCLKFDPAENEWEPSCRIPTELCNAGVCVLEDYVFLIGGWNGSERSEEIYRIKISDLMESNENWEHVANLPKGRSGHGCVAVDGKIYITGGVTDEKKGGAECGEEDVDDGEDEGGDEGGEEGGETDQDLVDCFIFDTKSLKISPMSDYLIEYKSCAPLFYCKSTASLYTIDLDSDLPAERYDLIQKKWFAACIKGHLPTKRSGFSSAQISDTEFCTIGGGDCREVERYRVDSKDSNILICNKMSGLSEPRNCSAAAVADGWIYVAGGEYKKGMIKLELTTDINGGGKGCRGQWERCPDMPTGRRNSFQLVTITVPKFS